ncbi:hypothetical protein [Methylophaga sp.]|uniref:hypothetical protein n=1 Tax=Methylophaga sp. TaxID=2024840 RepID=UPI003F699C2F
MKLIYINDLYRFALGFTLVSALTACGGEFSYKRGASVQDLQNQKTDCDGNNRSEEEVNKCLKDNGWIVVDMDSDYSLKPRKLKTLSTTYSKSQGDPFAVEETLAMEEASEATVTEDPLDVIKVNSWWKAGAGPEQLYQNGDACLESLGEDYKANANFSEVSLGIAYCMEDKGWRALLAK